jgi:putative tributyrin esterase
MALARFDFFSEVLGHGTSMTVLLPETPFPSRSGAGDQPEGPPVLYLLHGLGDDATSILRNTAIGRYADQLGLAVVMPQTFRSFAIDEAHGEAYWTFLSEELPAVLHRHFRLSQRRADTFVGGISMGGYAAMKLAVLQPERFAAAAALSGAVDLVGVIPRRPERGGDWQRIFGGRPVAGTDDDLLAVLDRVQDTTALPRLWVCCGEQEELYADNVRFVETAARRGIAVTTDFGPGEHTYAYWDRELPRLLAWLPD